MRANGALRILILMAGGTIGCVIAASAGAAAISAKDSRSIERGRYVVRIAGCNDCHTPGEPAPAYLPPGTNPTGPYVTFP